MDAAGIDYHVMLAANALQQCLDTPELQPELLCALVKQTSRPAAAHAAGSGAASSTSGASDGGRGGKHGGVQVMRLLRCKRVFAVAWFILYFLCETLQDRERERRELRLPFLRVINPMQFSFLPPSGSGTWP